MDGLSEMIKKVLRHMQAIDRPPRDIVLCTLMLIGFAAVLASLSLYLIGRQRDERLENVGQLHMVAKVKSDVEVKVIRMVVSKVNFTTGNITHMANVPDKTSLKLGVVLTGDAHMKVEWLLDEKSGVRVVATKHLMTTPDRAACFDVGGRKLTCTELGNPVALCKEEAIKWLRGSKVVAVWVELRDFGNGVWLVTTCDEYFANQATWARLTGSPATRAIMVSKVARSKAANLIGPVE